MDSHTTPSSTNHEPTFFLASAHLDSRPLYYAKPALLRMTGLLRRGHSAPVACTWLTGDASSVLQHSAPGTVAELSPLDSHSEAYIDVMVTCETLVRGDGRCLEGGSLRRLTVGDGYLAGSRSSGSSSSSSSSSDSSTPSGSSLPDLEPAGRSPRGTVDPAQQDVGEFHGTDGFERCGSEGCGLHTRSLLNSTAGGSGSSGGGTHRRELSQAAAAPPSLLSWVHVTVVQVLWNASAGADPLLWPSPAVPFLPCPITSQPQTPEPDPGKKKSVTGSKPPGGHRRRLTADGSGSGERPGSGAGSGSQHGAHTRSRGDSGGSELASGSVLSGHDDPRGGRVRGQRRLSEAAATVTERRCDPTRSEPFLNKPPGSHLMSFQDYDNGDGGVAVCMAPLHGGDLQAATLPAWSIFQRLMGVEKVFVYKSSVSRVVAEMLQGFVDSGLYEIYEYVFSWRLADSSDACRVRSAQQRAEGGKTGASQVFVDGGAAAGGFARGGEGSAREEWLQPWELPHNGGIGHASHEGEERSVLLPPGVGA
ncbi:MAG: hypothetical protein WDW38_002078 [Sanguina aurantia]